MLCWPNASFLVNLGIRRTKCTSITFVINSDCLREESSFLRDKGSVQLYNSPWRYSTILRYQNGRILLVCPSTHIGRISSLIELEMKICPYLGYISLSDFIWKLKFWPPLKVSKDFWWKFFLRFLIRGIRLSRQFFKKIVVIVEEIKFSIFKEKPKPNYG